MSSTSLWERFQKYFLRYADIGFELDISRMRFPGDFFKQMEPKIRAAYEAMAGLEAGEIANPDENRMAGHYWLRAPQLAPTAELREEIEKTDKRILEFAAAVHAGKIAAGNGKPFTDVLLIGIGGSALGPQFVADALGSEEDAMRVHFLDNTDPDGFDAVLDRLGSSLAQTLVLVISKSGGTKETRNGMIETEKRCATLGLDFPKQAVAVTGEGSDLDKLAAGAGWLARFPMWDWVGGRTSIMSAVGLLPMALQGIDTKAFLAGAAAMDGKTRQRETAANAAMLLALMWHYAGNGRGEKDMVILPYKDRLVLFSRYLQQLVMESLGKERDLDGRKVNQGIAVYGNKGSTDQHAYVQQLREGVANFFVTFIDVAKNRVKGRVEVEPGITSGDYLEGFLRGTRAALYENGRDSITLTLSEVTPFTVGTLIAVYDRAVGFYGGLVHVNAYHQPGVEAGKKAATRVLELQKKVQALLKSKGKGEWSAEEVAAEAGADAEEVYHALSHLAANSPEIEKKPGPMPGKDRFVTR